MNLYTYVSNTPLNYVDLLGLAKALIFVGVDKPNLNLLVMEVPFGTLEKVYQIQRQKYIAM